MRTDFLTRSIPICILALFVAYFTGCSDDDPAAPGDPNPDDSPWSVVELPAELPDGSLTGIALFNNSSAAVGAGIDGNGILLENTSQGWRSVDVAELESASIWDVAIDGVGRRVMAGFTMSGAQLVIEEGPPWRLALEEPLPPGGLLAIASDGMSTFKATGSAGGPIPMWTGSVEGDWTSSTVPTPGDPNEKAFWDIAYGNGIWVGCGFDDGGEGTVEQPYSLLMIDDGSGWELVDAPCLGCGNQEYRAVAVSDQGTVYLGGAVTDFSGGSADEYTAFLRTYVPATGEWTEIILPDPGGLDRVNAILLSSEGDIYLACGEDGASLVRLPTSGGSTAPENIEWSADDASLRGLAESGAGTVYAVGDSSASEQPRPFMLARESNP